MPRVLDPILGPSGYDLVQAFGAEFKHWRAALANVKNGAGKARVLMVGDSIIEGYGQTTVATQIVTKFRIAMQQTWRPGGEGYVPAVLSGGIANRWTTVGGSTADNSFGLGRRSFFMSAVTDSATITFYGDRFQLFYGQYSTAGNMKIVVDGGAPILFSTNNATSRTGRVWDSSVNGGLTLTRGSHTVVVSADNTLSGHLVYSVILEGIMIYDADFSNGVQVFAAGRSGYTSSQYWNATLSNANNFWATGMDNILPDLVVIELGLNDLGLDALSAAQFKLNIIGIVTSILNNGSINTSIGYTPSVVLLPLWGRADVYSTGTIATNTSTPRTIVGTGTAWTAGLAALGANGLGAKITGPNIPANTYVVGWSSATGITINQDVTGTASGGAYTITYQDAQWEPYRRATYEMARDNGYAVWDMYDYFGYIGTDVDSMTFDKIHPSDKGAQAIATEMTLRFTGSPDLFFVPRGLVNAVGDTMVASGDNAVVRLPAGLVDGQVLTTRAAAQNPDGVTVGVEWVDPLSAGTLMQVKKDPGAATVTAMGIAAPTLTATASSADDAAGPWLNSATTAVSGNASGIISTAFTLLRRDWLFEYVTRILTDPTAITTLRYWIGVFSAAPDASATPAVHIAAFRYDTTADGTAFWRAVVDNGSGTPDVTVTTVAIAVNTVYILRIAATATSVLFYVNGLLVATKTGAKLPTSSQLLGYGNRVTALAAAIRNLKTSRIGLSYV